MTKHKYFKIKKIRLLDGSIIFKVFSYASWLDMLFGFDTEYRLENKTFQDAIYQIETISESVIIEEKTVYKTKLKTQAHV